jgi:hypothetical protein
MLFMSVYLDEEDCKKILQKSIATAIKKLNEINEINDKNSKKYKKLVEELKLINNIIESINSYVDLNKT